MLARVLAALALATLVGVWAPAGATAAPTPPSTKGSCDQNPDPLCSAWGGGTSTTGTKTGGSGCTWQGQIVPCEDPRFGFYTGGGCYWRAYDPPPNVPAPIGQVASKGRWGAMSCYTARGSAAVTQTDFWRLDPQNAPAPAELAKQALAKIHLLGARVGIAPRANGSGAVGLPVWLWTTVAAGTWGPLTATAAGGGITVTITAKAHAIVWATGDGHETRCDNPGTPYDAGYGMTQSPTCGYVYATPSVTAADPDGRYTITATTLWTVTWVGGGQTGTLAPTSQSQTTIRIGEIPVVVSR